MSLRWYAFLCGFSYDVLLTIDHLRSISFFYQNAHHDWLTKEYISNWFLVSATLNRTHMCQNGFQHVHMATVLAFSFVHINPTIYVNVFGHFTIDLQVKENNAIGAQPRWTRNIVVWLTVLKLVHLWIVRETRTRPFRPPVPLVIVIVSYRRTLKEEMKMVRARSQIPVLGLTGRANGSRTVVTGSGFSGQNLRIKYIPCVGTQLWIIMPAKSTSSYTKFTYVNRNK